jgi:hypothetical protein
MAVYGDSLKMYMIFSWMHRRMLDYISTHYVSSLVLVTGCSGKLSDILGVACSEKPIFGVGLALCVHYSASYAAKYWNPTFDTSLISIHSVSSVFYEKTVVDFWLLVYLWVMFQNATPECNFVKFVNDLT